MIYPAPTQPPLRDAPEPVLRVAEHVPYPKVTDGRGIPARIAPIGMVRLDVGQIFQLQPELHDVTGAIQQSTERFSFVSNSPRVLVSDAGLISTNCPPSVVSRRGAGESAKITISYGSTATISVIAEVFVSTDRDHLVSD
jgi:hypothetical protein